MGGSEIPLRDVRVRVARPDEEERWNRLVRERHYLGFRNFCGRRLRHVATLGDEWLALVGWHAAALHCAARDRWIGWSSLQRRQRLFPVAHQSRFLLLPGDWLALHGHAVLLAETFVDPARFAGTCCRAANWTEIGVTAGFGRARGGGIGYVPHGAPKRVLVYPLRRDARRQLRAAEAHPAWTPWRHEVQLRDSELASLYDKLCRVQDPRGERGKRYALSTVLTIVGAARLAGASTLTGISEFGRAPSPGTLRRIGCRERDGGIPAPGISTLHDILKRLDGAGIERLAGEWMAHRTPDGDAVAMDGKTMRGSCDRDPGAGGEPLDEPPQQQLAAVGIGSRRVLAHAGCSGKKDEAEGAALRDLLASVRKPGRCVAADALRAQRATAARIVELGMRYALCVQGNQPTLLEQVRDDRTWSDPCTVEVTGDRGRIETRTIQVSEDFPDCPERLDFPDARRAFRIRREVEYRKTGRKRKVETACFVTNLRGKAARPQRLPDLVRGYWGAVENGIRYVRDTAPGEDRCRARKGALPRIMAAFANLAITILRMPGQKNIRRAMRNFGYRPDRAARTVRRIGAPDPVPSGSRPLLERVDEVCHQALLQGIAALDCRDSEH